MLIEKDPALAQEVSDHEEETATVPQVEEEEAEGSEVSEEGSAAQQGDHEEEEGEEEAEEGEEPAEELEIVVDGEKPPPPAPKNSVAWARNRKRIQELEAENAEFKRREQARSQPAAVPEPGEKPTYASCGFDDDRFEQELDRWKNAEAAHRQHKAQAEQSAAQADRAWSTKLASFEQGEAELVKEAPSYPKAKAAVRAMFDDTRLGLIVKYAKKPEMVVFALGQRPELARELLSEEDYIQFGINVRELEGRLTTKKKPQAPPPEKPVRGTARVSGSSDTELERLRAIARENGDFTPVREYKEKLKQRAKR